MGSLLRQSFQASDAQRAEAPTQTAQPPQEAVPDLGSPEAVPASPETPVVPGTEQPPTEQATEQPTEQPADVALDFSEGLEPDSKSEDGKRYFTTASRWQKFQAAAKLVTELQNVIPNVTPETLIERVQMANAADDMMTTYQEAATNPQAIKGVVDLFVGEGEPTPQIRQAFASLALDALDRLPNINPEAFNRVLSVHNQRTVDALRERARQTIDPEQRKMAVALAQRFEEAVTGRYTKAADWMQRTVDPVQAERQRIDQERQQLQQERQKMADEAQQNWQNHVATSQQSTADKEIEGIFGAKAKEAYANTPDWANMKNELLQRVMEAYGGNQEWSAMWSNLSRQASLTRSETALNNLIKFETDILRRVGRQHAAQILNRYGLRRIEQNSQAHQAARNVPVNSPNPNGSPTPAPNGALDAVAKSKDLRDLMRSMWTTR